MSNLPQLEGDQERYYDALLFVERSLTSRELANLLVIRAVNISVLNKLVASELVSHFRDNRGKDNWMAIPNESATQDKI